MIEKLVETKTPSKYSDKVFNYAHQYEETEFETLNELIDYHENCEDYAIAYSGLHEYVSYHFPATTQNRTIYRQKCDQKMQVGIHIFKIQKDKEK